MRYKQFRFALFVVLVAVAQACSSHSNGPPYQSGSPWPKFRGDAVQDGATSHKPPAAGGAFWSFHTGKGIFSSPVVAADGTILIGSADRTFYALHKDGTPRWNVPTGEIIDSAGLLDDRGHVYFGSGDGNLRAVDLASGTVLWTTPADVGSTNGGYINWFEGNVALSPAGELYAPNDNFNLYTFDRQGGAITQRLKLPDQIWSSPAFAGDGRLFIGNNNVVQFLGSNLFSFDKKGVEKWDQFIGLGSVAASPLYTPDGLVVVSGFDGYVRAFDANTGAERWSYGTRDHLYASPARLHDGTIVQAGTDGTVYGLDGKSGAVRWTYDLRDPIRSSPAVDGDDNIYFGAGDGRLYVLDKSGALRWSVDLIDEDRNDVNSSPALGDDAIYIGGESGDVFSIPYDYCLRAGKSEARCAAPTPPTLPGDGGTLLYTTQFGAQLATSPAHLDPNQPIVLSLVARAGGHDILALIDSASVSVTSDPPNTLTVDVAGDGKYLTITPTQPLSAAADGSITLHASAGYLVDPARDGLKLSGGHPGGTATLELHATLTAPSATPFAVKPTQVWEVRRMALPLPSLLPSYNQIGFDSLHYLVTIVDVLHGHTIAWLAGAKLEGAENRTVIDPTTEALFPLDTSLSGNFMTMLNQAGLSVKVTNIVIPFQSFRLAVQLADDGSGAGPVALTGSTVCAQIATYGPFLQKLGLCNPTTDVLSVAGAAQLLTYTGAQAPAPTEVGTVTVNASPSAVTATFAGSSLLLADHVAALLLVDDDSGVPVSLNYGLDTTRVADSAGHLTSITLPVAGKALPAHTHVYVLIDVSVVSSTVQNIPPM